MIYFVTIIVAAELALAYSSAIHDNWIMSSFDSGSLIVFVTVYILIRKYKLY